MAINRASIAKQLLPGLNAIFGLEYGSIDDESKVLFDTEQSDRAFEEEVLMTGFGEAPVKSEGGAVEYDSASEMWTARYTAETIALAFAVTEEAMEDNLYDTFAKIRAKALARAMASTKQAKASSVFNNGFTAGAYAGGDGVAFFSDSHPVAGSGAAGSASRDNTAANTALSEAAIESAVTQINKLEDDRGILIGARPMSLHVPPDLQFTADQILNSPMSTAIGVNPTTAANGATNVNDINAIKGIMPKGYMVNHRFSSATAYFIRTDVPNGTKHFVRMPLATKMDPDFDTGNMRFKARERYSFGFSDWRSYYGNQGA
jgi:hypothetical protein|tara:strand:+ start:5037 stop:5990 length:954 start_codon:yes stop_codon:yes gene_type:complete